ncbi:endonuclease/exonuclease/phosphatase family protein [Paenibacillus sp. J2TS4]|uniref:endonuclease/exonuclease/phosphatase family protein n=1 Tax=Paenibacillus sp. J2TS4 TaxID=2807194 RepID=UPI001B2D012A|nr:endonuclease/exonuclease/phosphatase family protein [Paenibacillus sp. J2TS4]GIP35693.1 metal-dependent hydrolase [Paenibacillus sp. J2TS4]
MGDLRTAVTIKVMSFNIYHGEGLLDGKLDLQRIAEVVRESGADVIGMQEVDKHFSERSDYEDQGKRLAESLSMDYAYGANLKLETSSTGEPDREYGTLILSRYPIVSRRNRALPQVDSEEGYNEPRGLLETHLNIEGQRVVFLNTHLGLNEVERNAQVNWIIQQYGDCPEPILLAGDFNAEPSSPEIRRLKEVFQDAFEPFGLQDEPTLLEYKDIHAEPAEYHLTKRIDYVFSSGQVQLIGAERINCVVSDHLPVTGIYRLQL